MQVFKSNDDIYVAVAYTYFVNKNGIPITADNKSILLQNISDCMKGQSYSFKFDLKRYQSLLDTLGNTSKLLTEIQINIFCDINFECAADVICAIATNQYLRDLIILLNNTVTVEFTYFNQNLFLELSNVLNEEVFNILYEILFNLIPEPNFIFDFLEYWEESGFSLHELKDFSKKISLGQVLDFSRIFKNHMTYLSFLYKDCYYDLVCRIENVSKDCCNLIVYALSNDKNRFLSILQKNTDLDLSSLNKYSVLFKKEFYTMYFNIDTLDEKSLLAILQIPHYNLKFDFLEKERTYTIGEIILLSGTCERYYRFYHMLNELKLDTRILITKQLKKNNLLDDFLWDEDLDSRLLVLAQKLTQKQIYDWMRQDFGHIDGINLASTMKLLLFSDIYSNYIKDITMVAEAEFLFRNYKHLDIKDNLSISKLKNTFLLLDKSCDVFCKSLNLSTDFVQENLEQIYSFWLQNGMNMVNTFLERTTLSNIQKQNLNLIVKAELAGKLKELKYHEGDLEKELLLKIPENLKTAWITNLEVEYSDFTIKECDDFFSTFKVGVVPMKTCLSYEGPMYAHCLLSNFDSNKKIINIFKNNILVGRALLRFTKAVFGTLAALRKYREVSFTDVTEKLQSEIAEKFIIFLECPYFSKLNEKDELLCIGYLLEFLRKKMNTMDNIQAVFSTDYNSYLNSNKSAIYRKEKCAMYISRSKSEQQYLDSLSGCTSVSDDGKYMLSDVSLLL